jgi:hypothetical protein
MSEAEAEEQALDQFIAENITRDDIHAAARRLFTFLTACVDGQIPEAKVSDQILAARSILEYAARMPDLLGEIAEVAGLASDEDVAMIASVLE